MTKRNTDKVEECRRRSARNMRSVYQYIHLDQLRNKKIVCFGCDSKAIEFISRLIRQNIRVDYFSFWGEENYSSCNLLNRQILYVKQIKELDNFAIVTEMDNVSKARKVLEQYSLDKTLVEIERIQSELLEGSNNIVYGTGNTADWLYEKVNRYFDIMAFCDSNRDKSGTYFHQKPVIHCSELHDLSYNTNVIIASIYVDEIKSVLLELGIDENNIYLELQNNIVPICMDSTHTIVYNLDDFIQLFRVCTGKEIVLYGRKNLVQTASEIFGYFGVEIKYSIESCNEYATIYSLLYHDMINTLCIIVDKFSEGVYEIVENMGLKYKVKWLSECGQFAYTSLMNKYCVLDPNLGYTYMCSNEKNTGFKKYEFLGGINKEPIVIMILGGSTSTSDYGVIERPWCECLSEVLAINNISHILYSGGIYGYTASQELIKLVRDGIWIKPNLVISYSGVNNMIYSSEDTPFVNNYQRTIFDSLKNQVVGPYGKTMKKVNYGEKLVSDQFEYWFTQETIMHNICCGFGIEFKGCLQPCLFSKIGIDFMDINTAVKLGFTWNNTNKQFDIIEGKKIEDYLIAVNQNATLFRSAGKEIDVSWFCDFSDLFDYQGDIYIDCCHVSEKGNQMIAYKMFEEFKTVFFRIIEKNNII